MKTLAAILVQTKKPLALEEIEIPKLRKGQILVKIHYSGICGTQLNEIDGKKKLHPTLYANVNPDSDVSYVRFMTEKNKM